MTKPSVRELLVLQIIQSLLIISYDLYSNPIMRKEVLHLFKLPLISPFKIIIIQTYVTNFLRSLPYINKLSIDDGECLRKAGWTMLILLMRNYSCLLKMESMILRTDSNLKVHWSLFVVVLIQKVILFEIKYVSEDFHSRNISKSWSMIDHQSRSCHFIRSSKYFVSWRFYSTDAA